MKRNLINVLIVFSIISMGLFLMLFLWNDVFKTSSRKIDRTLSGNVEIIKIAIDENAKNPSSMYLKMSGKINGKGIISFGWNDWKSYRKFKISNEFLVEYNNGDWYNDSCIIKYQPITATSGEVKIDCKIYSASKSKIKAIFNNL